MIRSLFNLSATCVVGLALVAGGLGVYQHARAGADSAVGKLWNYGGPDVRPTALPTVAVGVAVPTGVSHGIVALVPTDTPMPATPTATADPLAAECTWAAYTLHADAAQDRIGAQTYAQWRDYYNRIADQWDQLAGWIETGCAPTWPAPQCATARGRLAAGISTHETTGGDVAHDAAQDALWIANYHRVERLLQEVCP